MALVLADRVLETSTSEGLGTFALAGAQTGYQTFSNGIGDGNTCYYTINGQTTEQWEVGIGTVGAGTLARTTLISSNTGSFINFVAGVKNVFVTQPASKSIYKDENGNAIPLGSASATQLDITAQGDLRLQDTTGGEYVAIQAPATLASSYTLTMPTDDGTAGQALVTDGSGVLSWSTAASGDVYGPASATDNAVARYDGTTGKIIQNSAVTIGDDGATVIAANSSSDGLRITQTGAGNALLVEDSANPDATPFVINNSGAALVGVDTTRTLFSGYVPNLQIEGTTFSASSQSLTINLNNAGGSTLFFAKSRGTTNGSNTIVNANDTLGAIAFNGADGTDIQSIAAQISAAVDGTPGTDDMPGRLVFSTTADGASSPTERMRIDNAGRVGIGGTPTAFTKFQILGTLPSSSTASRSVEITATIPSTSTAQGWGFYTTLSTQASAFTLADMTHYRAGQGTIGATSAVTNQYGFNADSTLTGATNNYGFFSNIASGTGRWNFYAAGTAANYFAGNVGIGVTPTSTLTVNGTLAFGNSTGIAMSVSNDFGSNTYLTLAEGSNGLRVVNSTNTATHLTILSTGSVGIGTASTTAKLHVSGGYTGFEYNSGATYPAYNTYFAAIGSNFSSGGSEVDIWNTVSGGFAFRKQTAASAQTTLMYINANGTTSIGAAPGSESLRVTPVASAVNYVNVSGATTGNRVDFRVDGSDTNIGVFYAAKGTGDHVFRTNSYGGAPTQFLIAHTASAVNYLQVTGGATGNAATLSAQGSDTNIDLALTPKGTGVLKFGTYTAGILAQAGYIQIKDAAGNVRNLLVG